MTAPAMLSPKQIHAYATAWNSRVTIYDGSIRSGKSHTWLLLALSKIAAFTSGGAIVITGKNIDTVYRNVFAVIENEDTFATLRPLIKYRQGATTANMFGHTVHIIGADDVLAEGRIRGMSVALALVDEITLIHPNFWAQLLGRMSPPGAQLIGTTNPDSPGHWLRKDYLSRIPHTVHYKHDTPPEQQLHDWRLVSFVMDDNPALTETYKNAVRTEFTGLWYQRFVEGLWVAAEGAIYDTYDPNRHVINHDDLPHIVEHLALGIDYGTTHPTYGILVGLGDDNRLYAIDEWAPTPGSTDHQLANDLTQWQATRPTPSWTAVDPAAASFRTELWQRDWGREHGGHLTKADNAVNDGIRVIASLFSADKLRITDRCPNLIEEIPGYRWDPKATQRGEDKPVKEHDDAVDALRYAINTTYRLWDHILEPPQTHHTPHHSGKPGT